jgi:hypothetical protein
LPVVHLFLMAQLPQASLRYERLPVMFASPAVSERNSTPDVGFDALDCPALQDKEPATKVHVRSAMASKVSRQQQGSSKIKR